MLLNFSSLNYVDAIILVVWALSIGVGIFKGFIKQLFGILALVLACYCSYKFSGIVTGKLSEWFDWQGDGVRIVAFVATFCVVLLLVSLLGRLLDKIARVALLGWVNRLLGGVFGWIEGNLVLVILLYLLKLLDGIFPFLPEKEISTSVLYPYVEKFASLIVPYLPTIGQ